MNSWESVKVECMTTSLLVVVLAYITQNWWSLIVYWVTYFSLLIAHSNGTQITPLVHPTHPITMTIFSSDVMCSNVTVTIFVSLIGLKRNGCDYFQITKISSSNLFINSCSTWLLIRYPPSRRAVMWPWHKLCNIRGMQCQADNNSTSNSSLAAGYGIYTAK